MRKMNNKTLIVTALMAAVLAGCGGGGGDDDKGAGNTGTPGNPGTPPVTENTTGPDLQNSVPAPTYAAGSQEQDAWNVLQQARQACGFGMLKQDARLDAAAKAHANYLNANDASGHDEVAGRAGFTGATPSDRARAKGFVGSVGESVSYRSTARDSMIELLTAPYHALGSIWGWRSVGVGIGNSVLALNFGTENSAQQRLGSGVVANYPCEGAQNVAASWGGENPDPFPDLTEAKGTSVLLLSDPGSTLSITNLSFTRESNGQSVSYRTLTKANDRNGRVSANEYAAVPIEPLAYGESYRVTYSGTLNGSTIGKTFMFKTMVKPRQIVMCRNPQTGEVYKCYADTMERV